MRILSAPISKFMKDLEVRRSANPLRSICSGLAPSADHDSEVAIHAGRLIRLKQTQTETAESNNNNVALLSQTWVIAIATVLRVRTVPYVEPYTFG